MPEESQVDEREERQGPCGTMENLQEMAAASPEYAASRKGAERRIKEWLNRYGDGPLPTDVIRIPVVFHIVHAEDELPVSQEKIKEQVKVLNDDFRRLNADASQTLPQFAGVAADTRFEFALAQRDPECKLTNGITYKKTRVKEWVRPADGAKMLPDGHPPWDPSKYLNVWVINLVYYGGWSSFPGDPAWYDGIVLKASELDWGWDYTHGRMLTHEVGHWLGLIHIWGNDDLKGMDPCSRSDEVADTPNQGLPTKQDLPCLPDEVPTSCGNNGDMFQNYMDYTTGKCQNLFTQGQAMRMHAAFQAHRSSLLGSKGLVPPPAETAPDLWMQDFPEDTGVEPNRIQKPMWISNDIWVRNQEDGFVNTDHQNPVYRPSTKFPNWVYVRVRNRGCVGSATGIVKLYWAKGSPSLSWPAPWDGSVLLPTMGEPIEARSVTVNAGESKVLDFAWKPPNPADYAIFDADRSHFCLLARIETDTGPSLGMASLETWDIHRNVSENNNIAWKNVTVMGPAGAGSGASMIVGSFGGEERWETLLFEPVVEGGVSILDWGHVIVGLQPGLADAIDGEDVSGVDRIGAGRYEILEPGARIGRFPTTPLGDLHAVELSFSPHAEEYALGARVFELDAMQVAGNKTIGGVRFSFKAKPEPIELPDRSPTRFDGVEWVPVGELED